MTAGEEQITGNSFVLEAQLTWTGETFEPGLQVCVEGGVITSVARTRLEKAFRLDGQALLPGFVNAHSHAFQRGLRGRGEAYPDGRGSFWSWREEMYGLVASLDPHSFYELCFKSFREMLAAGITSVGEFHYLHHVGQSHDYGFDEVILKAARDAGIRIVLLNAFYRTGGVGKALEGAQLRFETPSVQSLIEQNGRLRRMLDSMTQSLGWVAHSIRAADIDEITALYRMAQSEREVFHMHVEEQPLEIVASLEHYGDRPMSLLIDRLAPDGRFTAVHCTHTQPAHLDLFFGGGANCCVCPLTEANLGDGIPAFEMPMGGGLCLGTDSNARISMLEEMRWLEYGQRLRKQQRGVFRDAAGVVAPALLNAATRNGARALGIPAGRIAAGCAADLVCVNLRHRDLSGWTPVTLANSLVFGAGDGVIASCCVGGRWVYARPDGAAFD